MAEPSSIPGPVAVGGVAGSGTRVVAQILSALGFYIGAHLNPASDNQWFTLLFRQPGWFDRNADRHPARILKRWEIFEKAMTGRLRPQPGELVVILRAALGYSFQSMWPGRSFSSMLRRQLPGSLSRVRSLLRSSQVDRSAYVGWGWKAPNTQFYLPFLIDHFADLKYVQVVRHGLDMAYRGKQKQLYNWHRVFDIHLPPSTQAPPKVMLGYWIKANQTVIGLGQERLGQRFHVLNYDRLCISPREEIEPLLAFLDIPHPDEAGMAQLLSLPRLPATSGRYKNHDMGIFSEEEINAVKALGFTIE